MARRLPKDVAWAEMVLEVEDRWCGRCGRHLHTYGHRRRRIFTLDGPRTLMCKLAHCPNHACVNHRHVVSVCRKNGKPGKNHGFYRNFTSKISVKE